MTETAHTYDNLLWLATVERKPLYLDSKSPTRIALEGPALSIRVQGQANRLIPLRRVSRILVNERTEFSTAAFLACADRGIGVVFVTAQGEVRARLLGTPGERQEMRQRLLDLLDRCDWRELYGNWRHSQECLAVRRVRWRLGAPEEVHTPKQTVLWVREQAQALAGFRDAESSESWLDEQMFAWMHNHLQQLGFGAQSELFQDAWPDLLGDLSRVHRWYGETLRLGWLRRRALWAERRRRRPVAVTRRDMIKLYQDNGAKLAGLGRELTNRLHKWLIELA